MSLRPARALLPLSDPSPAASRPTLAPSQRLGPHAHVVRVDVLLEAEEVNGTHRMYDLAPFHREKALFFPSSHCNSPADGLLLLDNAALLLGSFTTASCSCRCFSYC